jgi:hypothetical protein
MAEKPPLAIPHHSPEQAENEEGQEEEEDGQDPCRKIEGAEVEAVGELDCIDYAHGE